MDPWYDHVIAPAALVAVLIQVLAVSLRAERRKRRLAVVGAASVFSVFLLALIAPLGNGYQGANIGAGVVLALLPLSALLLLGAFMRSS